MTLRFAAAAVLGALGIVLVLAGGLASFASADGNEDIPAPVEATGCGAVLIGLAALTAAATLVKLT